VQLPAWVRRYIGLPYVEHGRGLEGVDCWGLLHLVLGEQFGIEVPAYAHAYPGTGGKHATALGALIRDQLLQPDWQPVPLAEARPGDGLLMRAFGQPLHVGVVVCPGWMLHARHGDAVVAERYLGPHIVRKLEPRPYGCYRHH
jgi:murein DD-endopeptidase / murein LD-carboxypeptidase